jgi:hypothetical protein
LTSISLIEMNFSKVERQEFFRKMKGNIQVDRHGCWNWLRGKMHGYGSIWFAGKRWTVHRLSYLIFSGEIPTGRLICHHCDNPSCCNPDHLYVGTAQDNMRDRDLRGRNGRKDKPGRRHGKDYKLNQEKVIQIRKAIGSQREIAKLFEIHPSQISKVLSGKRWAWVTI